MRKEVITTSDGSKTLFVPQLEEHYHSVHGAMQESVHVFIQAGLQALPASLNTVRILEVGMGTGLNVLLTYQHLQDQNTTYIYDALEAYPVDWETVASMGYASEALQDTFAKIHQSPSQQTILLSDGFQLLKLEDRLETVALQTPYHLIYFDCFAPRVQPELWTLEVFQKMYNVLEPSGMLVTYCAKGDVRRAMLAAGFEVEKLPGPPGKREMLRARKPSDAKSG